MIVNVESPKKEKDPQDVRHWWVTAARLQNATLIHKVHWFSACQQKSCSTWNLKHLLCTLAQNWWTDHPPPEWQDMHYKGHKLWRMESDNNTFGCSMFMDGTSESCQNVGSPHQHCGCRHPGPHFIWRGRSPGVDALWWRKASRTDATTAWSVAVGPLELPSAGRAGRSLPMTEREAWEYSMDREAWRSDRDRLFPTKGTKIIGHIDAKVWI